jgi:hypothetical protein
VVVSGVVLFLAAFLPWIATDAHYVDGGVGRQDFSG